MAAAGVGNSLAKIAAVAEIKNDGARLVELVKDYIEHLHHHLRFVREKRAKLGKPMTEPK